MACTTRGSGVIEETEYEVEAFDEIVLSDGFDGFVYKGETFAVRTNTDDNLTSLVKFEQVDGQILIRLKDDASTRKTRLEATFIVPEIKKITLSGNSSISAPELGVATELEVNLSGSSEATIGFARDKVLDRVRLKASQQSRITLSLDSRELQIDADNASSASFRGSAETATYNLSDNSRVSARSFTVERAELDFSTGSSATLSVTGSVTGEMKSNSSLRISGGAAVELERSGNTSLSTN